MASIDEVRRLAAEFQRVQLTIAKQNTDIIFVAGYADADGEYRLLNASSTEAKNNILSNDRQIRITTAIGGVLDKEIDNIRLPYGQTVIFRSQITKSYIWWMDDPWAALVALAAIIILLAIVGIIVIIFSHSRYMKFISQYRIYQSSYDNPDFQDPPNFLREYETQSLNMYVPPDEAIHSYGEVGLQLQDDRLVNVQHYSHDSGVAAAVNPVYQNDQAAAPLEHPPQPTPIPESTTML